MLSVLPRPGDSEVQPAASESASRPEEARSAARHSLGRRSDRLHLRPPGALRPTGARRLPLRRRLFTHNSAGRPQLFAPFPLAASALPVCAATGCRCSSPTATTSAASSTSPLGGPAAGRGRGEQSPPCAAPPMRVRPPAPGCVFPSVLRQQSVADGEEEAEEDGVAGLVAVEER